MALRKRPKVDYRETTDIIDSTRYWKRQTSAALKIETVDCTLEDMFSGACIKAENLILPQWEDSQWLTNVNIDTLNVTNKVKSLIAKIKFVSIAQSTILEMYVDGFMDTLLHILEFDDYPCLMYPQYEYFADIGEEDEHHIVAKSDFGILSHHHRMLIVIEDKTLDNAKYSNNWKEDQVLGELFVAVHNTVRNHKDVHYPINIHAVRVVGTLFTFYKTVADKEYVKETVMGYPTNNSMTVQRHPPVVDELNLTAYDICNIDDRKQILKCMSSIKEFLV